MNKNSEQEFNRQIQKIKEEGFSEKLENLRLKIINFEWEIISDLRQQRREIDEELNRINKVFFYKKEKKIK